MRMGYSTRNRDLIHRIKDVPCADCGNKFPSVCMDFDHRDPNGKVANISQLINTTVDKLIDEIAKCDIICSNCHRIRTHKRRSDPDWISTRIYPRRKK